VFVRAAASGGTGDPGQLAPHVALVAEDGRVSALALSGWRGRTAPGPADGVDLAKELAVVDGDREDGLLS
jgi:hypothetical protein